MPIKNTTHADPVKRFWDKYIQYLSDQGVKPSAARWYVIRIEHYIHYFKDKRLALHRPEDVERYLANQAENPEIQDWQFCQLVDAIRNLFAMLNVACLNEVDWQHWLTSAPLGTIIPRSRGRCRRNKQLTG